MSEQNTPLTVSNRTLLLTTVVCMSVILAALHRLVPYLLPADHPLLPFLWNFTPITAMALFAAASFRSRWVGLALPLLAMILSDLVLHFMGWAPSTLGGRALIYGCMAGICVMGWMLGQNRSVTAIAGVTLTATLFFWLITNFLVWALSIDAPAPKGYPKTLDGFLECYTMALPFLRNAIMGDACYATVLFGGFALAQHYVPSLREQPAAAAC